jgi:hypothetical protein
MLEPSSAIECLDFFHPACAELGFEIRVAWIPFGVASRRDQINRGPSFTVGRMKRRTVIALYFELRPRWQSRGFSFGYRAALVLNDTDFL